MLRSSAAPALLALASLVFGASGCVRSEEDSDPPRVVPDEEDAGPDATAGDTGTDTAVDPTCGNGTVEGDEVCDDGNTEGGDGCSADCSSDETCGNGIVDDQAGEECDAGDDLPTAACTESCESLSGTVEWAVNFQPTDSTNDDLFDHEAVANAVGPDGDLFYAMISENRLSGILNPQLYRIRPDATIGWARDVFESRAGNGMDPVEDLAITGAGSVMTVGHFESDELAFLENERALEVNSGSDEYLDYSDGFTASFDPNGDFKAARSFGNAEEDESVDALGVHSSGDAFLAGTHDTSFQIGSESIPAGTGFFAKTTPQGATAWSLAMEGGEPTAVASTPAGGAVLAGEFDETSATIGETRVEAADDSWDCFVMKFAADGSMEWGVVLDGPAADRAVAVSVSESGAVSVAGTFAETLQVADTELGPARGSESDAYVVRLSPTGDVQWAQAFGGTGRVTLNDAVTDADGDLYVAGEFSTSSIDFGSGSLSAADSGSVDGFVAKLDPTGQHLWSHALGGADTDRASALATDGTTSLYVTGVYRSSRLSTPAGGLEKSYADSVFETYIARLIP